MKLSKLEIITSSKKELDDVVNSFCVFYPSLGIDSSDISGVLYPESTEEYDSTLENIIRDLKESDPRDGDWSGFIGFNRTPEYQEGSFCPGRWCVRDTDENGNLVAPPWALENFFDVLYDSTSPDGKNGIAMSIPNGVRDITIIPNVRDRFLSLTKLEDGNVLVVFDFTKRPTKTNAERILKDMVKYIL